MFIIFDYILIKDHPNLVIDTDTDDIDISDEIEKFYDAGQNEKDEDEVQKINLINRQGLYAEQQMALKPAFDLDIECQNCGFN
jgi:hypothetical protein